MRQIGFFLVFLAMGIPLAGELHPANSQENNKNPIDPKVKKHIDNLKSPSISVRRTAAVSLGTLKDKAALPALFKALEDKENIVRTAAAYAIRRIGPEEEHVPLIVKGLTKINYSQSRHLLDALKYMGPKAVEATPDLVKLAANPKTNFPNATYICSTVLPYLGEKAIPDLAKFLDHEDLNHRAVAARALLLNVHKHKAASKVLTKALPNIVKTIEEDAGNSRLTYYVVILLPRLGKITIPHLSRLAKHKSSFIRTNAVRSLGYLKEDGKEAIPVVVKALEDEDQNVRQTAGISLGFLAKSFPKETLPVFRKLVQSAKEKEVLLSLLYPLRQAGENGVPILLEILKKNPNPEIRNRVLLTVEQMGPQAKAAIPALQKIMHKSSIYDRIRIAGILSKLGDTTEARQVLEDALLSDSIPIRRYAQSSAIQSPIYQSFIEQLKSDDAKKKLRAVKLLQKVSNMVAAEPLSELLTEEDPQLREEAVKALAAGRNTRHLLKLMGSKNKQVARLAAKALSQMDYRYLRNAGILGWIKSEDPYLRLYAMQAISLRFQFSAEMAKTLAADFANQEIEIKRLAAQTVATILKPPFPGRISFVGTSQKQVEDLAKEMLTSKDLGVRVRIAEAFVGNNPVSNSTTKAKDIAKIFAEGLQSKNAETKQISLESLARLGNHAAPARKDLLRIAREGETENRRLAISALMKINSGEKKLPLSFVMELVQDKNPDFRAYAIELLETQGTPKEKIIPALVSALKDEDQNVRWNAIVALGNYEEEAKTAVPWLVGILNQPNESGPSTLFSRPIPGLTQPTSGNFLIPRSFPNETCHNLALDTLAKIGSSAENAVPPLQKMMTDADSSLKSLIIYTCSKIGGKAEVLVLKGLQDKDKSVRQKSVLLIGNLPQPSEKAVTALKEIVAKNDDPDIQQQAIFALSRFGAKAKAAVPILIDTLSNEKNDPDLRGQAAQAIGEIGSAVAEAIPELNKALQSEHRYLRQWAAFGLGKIGSKAADSAPALRKLLKDESIYVRLAAKTALENIEGN